MPEEHRDFHIITEALSVFALVPYLFFLSYRVSPVHKWILRLIILMCILVDGFLLIKADEWNNKEKFKVKGILKNKEENVEKKVRFDV